MSGKPYPEGVQAVMDLLDTQAKLHAEILELQPKAERLKEAYEQEGIVTQRIGELMDKMDIEGPGNWGHGNRIGWFLAEMRRRIVAAAEKAS